MRPHHATVYDKKGAQVHLVNVDTDDTFELEKTTKRYHHDEHKIKIDSTCRPFLPPVEAESVLSRSRIRTKSRTSTSFERNKIDWWSILSFGIAPGHSKICTTFTTAMLGQISDMTTTTTMTATSDTPLPTSNRAVALVGPRQLEIQQRPVQAPSDGELLIKVIATGMCGSDGHAWKADHKFGPDLNSEGLKSRSLILGHESAGIVHTVGPGVEERYVGQRVAIMPDETCGECEFCLRGQMNICARLKYCGLDPVDGTLCQFYTCKAVRTVPLPDDLDLCTWPVAGSIQPLAVAIQIARRANIRSDKTLAILGCGPLALLVLAVAKARGVQTVVMFDRNAPRTAFAEQYGATKAFTRERRPANEESLKEQPWIAACAKSTLTGCGIKFGFDVIVETTGAVSCVQLGLHLLKAGGTLVQAGLDLERSLTPIPLLALTARELNLLGIVRYTHDCYEEAVELITSKKVDLGPLITGTYPLTKIEEAFEAQQARKHIKIVIMNQE